MREKAIQITGIVWTLAYAVFIIWLYAAQPRTLREVAAEARVVSGVYQVNQQQFDEALNLFRREQFTAARDAFRRADPAQRDARTQFYIAYAFYRQGWGHLYSDDELFRQGLEAVNRAIELAPGGSLTVDDEMLGLRTAAELKNELEQGLSTSWSDINPLKVLRERK